MAMPSKFRSRISSILSIPQGECERYFGKDRKAKKMIAKEYFIREGEVCSDMAFVDKGVMRMFYISPEGKEINTQFFFENDFVLSYQSFLLQRPSKYFIQAIKECELIPIAYDKIQNAYENSFLWQKFGRIVAEKSFVNAEQRTESLLFLNAEERYLGLQKKNPKIPEQVPLYHIASYLGIERETLSRIRKKLTIK